MLETILSENKKLDKVAAVFDLDSTLYDVSPRSKQIILDICQLTDFKNKYPDQCEKLASVDVLPSDWGIEDPLLRANVVGKIDFFKAISIEWRLRFFSNDYLKYDMPYEGAVDFVNSLHQAGVSIYYLTGRDTERMHQGSIDSLVDCSFPLTAKNRLIMKPKKGESDSKFKLAVMHKKTTIYDSIWFFENEPVNINLILKELPQINNVFFDSVHSGRESLSVKLPTLKLKF